MLRCEDCNKVAYTSEESAQAAVARIPNPMRAYYSESCGFWHLTTVREGS